MTKTPESTPPCPVMTKEKFSELSGIRCGQLRSQIQEGNIATVNIGRLRVINIAKMHADCLKDAE